MSVFLRWGIFGILAVAALVYAYQSSKRLADTRGVAVSAAPASHPPPAPVQAEAPAAAPDVEAPSAVVEPAQPADPLCEQELQAAQRAIDMRKQGEPLDRVLRIPEIAWQEPAARRERLAAVASRWYGYESEFTAQALRIAVFNDCARATAPP